MFLRTINDEGAVCDDKMMLRLIAAAYCIFAMDLSSAVRAACKKAPAQDQGSEFSRNVRQAVAARGSQGGVSSSSGLQQPSGFTFQSVKRAALRKLGLNSWDLYRAGGVDVLQCSCSAFSGVLKAMPNKLLQNENAGTTTTRRGPPLQRAGPSS